MLRFLVPAILLGLTGCVSQPAWLASQPKVQCGVKASRECVAELLARNLTPASPIGAIRTAKAALASVGVSDSPALAELDGDLARYLCLRPDDELLRAADSVALARQGSFQAALTRLEHISDKDAQTFGLKQIAVLASLADDDESTARALTLLAKADEDAYMESLQARLLVLLKRGDLERASALRDILVAHALRSDGDPLKVVQVAVSYLTTGHTADANDVLRSGAPALSKIGSNDVSQLVSLLAGAVNGVYPQPQQFFTFSSDEMRLQAYVQLALYYKRSGLQAYAQRIASDMSRFAQKRSYRADATVTAKGFSQVLIETL